jgi:5-formyltetrahydrofolate cyclo-ligase
MRGTKAALRQQVAEALARMPEQLRAIASAQARALLARQPLWIEAKSVLFYAPTPGELDVWPLLEEVLERGNLAALPRFSPASKCYVARQVQDLPQEVAPGRFGIREPAERCGAVSLAQIDLVLVPGVAFDHRGNRLGRGKGYYDQLLSGFRGITCGVGFDEQIVETVPVEEHDFRLNYVLTPTRWISGAQRG